MIFEKPKWELVVDYTYRMKTSQGWLIRDDVLQEMCYVPDPGHAWQWTSLVEEVPNEEA